MHDTLIVQLKKKTVSSQHFLWTMEGPDSSNPPLEVHIKSVPSSFTFDLHRGWSQRRQFLRHALFTVLTGSVFVGTLHGGRICHVSFVVPASRGHRARYSPDNGGHKGVAQEGLKKSLRKRRDET